MATTPTTKFCRSCQADVETYRDCDGDIVCERCGGTEVERRQPVHGKGWTFAMSPKPDCENDRVAQIIMIGSDYDEDLR